MTLSFPNTAESMVKRSDRQSSVEFNTIFRWINIVLFCSTILFYYFNPFPGLVNDLTLVLYFFLFLQTHFFLIHEKGSRNAFLLLMCFTMVVFTFPRILTLNWFDESDPFRTLNRMRPTTVDDINYSMFFMLISNFFIFLGLIVVKKILNRNNKPSPIPTWKLKKVFYFFVVSFFLLCLSLVTNSGIFGDSNRLLTVVSFFFDAGRILPFALIYIFLASQNDGGGKRSGKDKRYILYIKILLVTWVITNYIFGNRSGIINMVQNLFIVSIIVGRFTISKKVFSVVIILLLVSIPLFFIGTISRKVRMDKDANFSLVQNIDIIITAAPAFFESGDLVLMLTPAFERASFLDYTVDLIKNADKYRQVVNVEQYFKSTVDALTPGFDVFNTPKSANALVGIYSAGGSSQRTVLPGEYQSDQFNVYGELYVAFGGWASLPVFFIFTALFYKAYVLFIKEQTARNVIWRFFVISQFYNWLRSFGTDWLIVYTIYEFLAYYMFTYLFEHRFISGVKSLVPTPKKNKYAV